MASHLPARPPLVVPVSPVAAGGFLTVVAAVLLARILPFAWRTFFLVMHWALLAYFVIGALLAFVFVHNHVTGSTLGVLIHHPGGLRRRRADDPGLTVARDQDPTGEIARSLNSSSAQVPVPAVAVDGAGVLRAGTARLLAVPDSGTSRLAGAVPSTRSATVPTTPNQ